MRERQSTYPGWVAAGTSVLDRQATAQFCIGSIYWNACAERKEVLGGTSFPQRKPTIINWRIKMTTEEIRLEALRLALGSHSETESDATIVKRAQVFEEFLSGKIKPAEPTDQG
jgi:hypothetical protein